MKLLPVTLLVLLGAFGCMACPFGPKEEEASDAPAAIDHGSDFLVWSMDPTSRQSTTTWVSATAGASTAQAGITLPGAGKLWDWTIAPVEIQALDCGCYDPYNLPASDAGRARRRLECIRPTRLDTLTMIPRGGGSPLPLLSQLPDDGGDPNVFEGTITRKYTPLGAVGPWFFYARREETMACASAGPVVRWTFDTLDMRVPKAAQVLLPADLARVEGVEKPKVAEALCVAPDCFRADPAKVRFALLRPGWNAEKRLVARLQFYSEATLGSDDGLWDSGTRSVLVDAAELPSELTRFVDTPPSVQAFWGAEVPEQGGWMPADAGLKATFGSAGP